MHAMFADIDSETLTGDNIEKYRQMLFHMVQVVDVLLADLKFCQQQQNRSVGLGVCINAQQFFNQAKASERFSILNDIIRKYVESGLNPIALPADPTHTSTTITASSTSTSNTTSTTASALTAETNVFAHLLGSCIEQALTLEKPHENCITLLKKSNNAFALKLDAKDEKTLDASRAALDALIPFMRSIKHLDAWLACLDAPGQKKELGFANSNIKRVIVPDLNNAKALLQKMLHYAASDILHATPLFQTVLPYARHVEQHYAKVSMYFNIRNALTYPNPTDELNDLISYLTQSQAKLIEHEKAATAPNQQKQIANTISRLVNEINSELALMNLKAISPLCAQTHENIIQYLQDLKDKLMPSNGHVTKTLLDLTTQAQRIIKCCRHQLCKEMNPLAQTSDYELSWRYAHYAAATNNRTPLGSMAGAILKFTDDLLCRQLLDDNAFRTARITRANILRLNMINTKINTIVDGEPGAGVQGCKELLHQLNRQGGANFPALNVLFNKIQAHISAENPFVQIDAEAILSFLTELANKQNHQLYKAIPAELLRQVNELLADVKLWAGNFNPNDTASPRQKHADITASVKATIRDIIRSLDNIKQSLSLLTKQPLTDWHTLHHDTILTWQIHLRELVSLQGHLDTELNQPKNNRWLTLHQVSIKPLRYRLRAIKDIHLRSMALLTNCREIDWCNTQKANIEQLQQKLNVIVHLIKHPIFANYIQEYQSNAQNCIGDYIQWVIGCHQEKQALSTQTQVNLPFLMNCLLNIIASTLNTLAGTANTLTLDSDRARDFAQIQQEYQTFAQAEVDARRASPSIDYFQQRRWLTWVTNPRYDGYKYRAIKQWFDRIVKFEQQKRRSYELADFHACLQPILKIKQPRQASNNTTKNHKAVYAEYVQAEEAAGRQELILPFAEWLSITNLMDHGIDWIKGKSDEELNFLLASIPKNLYTAIIYCQAWRDLAKVIADAKLDVTQFPQLVGRAGMFAKKTTRTAESIPQPDLQPENDSSDESDENGFQSKPSDRAMGPQKMLESLFYYRELLATLTPEAIGESCPVEEHDIQRQIQASIAHLQHRR